MDAVLAIDTSSRVCSAALSCPDGIFSRRSLAANSHSEDLAGITKALLVEAGTHFGGIGRIICGAGPGSFTGLRIGLAFAKGLAQGLSVPLEVRCSFHAAASQSDSSAGLVAVAADARRGEVFWAEYLIDPKFGASITSAPKIIAVEEAIKRIDAGARLIFSGAEFDFPGIGEKALGESSIAADLALGLLKIGGGVSGSQAQSASELARLCPTYIREAAARTIAERGKG